MCVSINMGLVTLIFDLETGLRVTSIRWEIFLPNLGTLGLWVLELFAMYATDGQTDGRTKATLTAPFHTGSGHKNPLNISFIRMINIA